MEPSVTSPPEGDSNTTRPGLVTPEQETHLRTSTSTDRTATARTTDSVPPASGVTNTSETPLTDDTIDYIGSFEYKSPVNKDSGDKSPADKRSEATREQAVPAIMMFPGFSSAQKPVLRTDMWPHQTNETPTPITIGKARRYLAAAYAEVNCKDANAGVHGYAWMVENKETWLARNGTQAMTAPTKPVLPTDPQGMFKYYLEDEAFNLYHHLVQEGKTKLVEWFGKAMFVDLHRKGSLPTDITPRAMLEHLEVTYGTAKDYRTCMEQVRKAFDTPYNPKTGVEAYFMRLEECRDDAEFLEDEFTPKQLMNKAIGEFIRAYGREGVRGEDYWDAKDATDKTWPKFKAFWKSRIHKFTTAAKHTTRHANEAILGEVGDLKDELGHMRVDVSALQAENRNHQFEQQALQARLQYDQPSRNSSGNTSSDDISALTDAVSRISSMEQRLNARMDKIVAASVTTGGTNGTGSTQDTNPTTADLLLGLQTKPVNHYSSLNDGKGLMFKKYCWYCGCTTTHWTRNCPHLSREQKDRYKNAHFKNRMGGSEKWIDRKGKHQAEFGFDSY